MKRILCVVVIRDGIITMKTNNEEITKYVQERK